MFTLFNHLDRDLARPWGGFAGNDVWREFDRIFREFDTQAVPQRARQSSSAFRELEDRYEMNLRIPGATLENVDVQVHENLLSISAKREVTVPEGYEATHRERKSLSFEESFRLPNDVDTNAVTATLTNGVLTVGIGKAKAAQPKQIPVKAG